MLAFVHGDSGPRKLLAQKRISGPPENRIMKGPQLKGRLKLSDGRARGRLGEIGYASAGKVLAENRHRSPTGHYPGLVSQAYRPQIRWLEGPSRARADLGSSERSSSLMIRMGRREIGTGAARHQRTGVSPHVLP